MYSGEQQITDVQLSLLQFVSYTVHTAIPSHVLSRKKYYIDSRFNKIPSARNYKQHPAVTNKHTTKELTIGGWIAL